MKVINNELEKLWDDLKVTIKPNSKMQVCASLFSMYWFESLKKELSKIDSLKFIFTDPTFIKDEPEKKESRRFEILAPGKEVAVWWSELEVRLKNQLKWKAIAKECAKWIKSKVEFKSNVNRRAINKFMNITNKEGNNTYLNVEQFDTVWFWYEKWNTLFTPVTKIDDNFEMTKYYMRSFDELWNDKENFQNVTDEVVNFIENLYKENSPEFIYYVALYNIFSEFLEDINEDELANEKTWFKDSVIWNTLYDFQKDAVTWIIHKLERHNWCILADSVWLWKTFTALAVIKYYQERNKSILVLCPKKLWENWNIYTKNYKDNILLKDRFNYHVLFHTDLSRRRWMSNGIDLSKINWWNYDLVVIDESHNFRNNSARDRETRYSRLMDDVMKAWVKTKVLMLSATPVNNRFNDLKNQLALAYEWDVSSIDWKISETKSIESILKNAQKIFNDWSKLPVEEKTNAELLRRLNSNFDFFKLLDSVTIARSRKHIEKYYDMDAIWKFPTRLKPWSEECEITDIKWFMTIKDIAEELTRLNMSVYSPFEYILPASRKKYEDKYDRSVWEWRSTLRQSDRETSLKILMRINFLKRLESSVDSFRITLNNVLHQINSTLMAIENFENNKLNSQYEEIEVTNYDTDADVEDLLDDEFSIWKKVKIDLQDMNTEWWKRDLEWDSEILKELLDEMWKITPDHDSKLQRLIEIISEKVQHPINPWNKKVIVFTAFADTANYIYENIRLPLKQKFNLDSAKVTWSWSNACTLPNINKDFNELLMNFSPISKHRAEIAPELEEEIEVLVATDCISEWQNLQDCDYLVNYDIHWNPVRIIQRFWRVDRIWSKNDVIKLVNFWPNMSLDDYIKLKTRVEDRMMITNATATWDDNVLTNKSEDMEYRVNQLQELKNNVVDIEDMNSWISITDLWLNDFRMDLIEYMNKNWNLKNIPTWLHSVVSSEEWIPKWVIYVLKNIHNEVNINDMNQLHPFYLVYIWEDWEIVSNHLSVKKTLDILRKVSKWKSEPIKEAYKIFNEETNDWNDMKEYSELLNQSISSIISVKEDADKASLFRPWWTSMLKNSIKWLEDFELILFMVVV